MFFKRVEADEWIGYIFEIMLTYNDKMVHSATNMTPSKARQNENQFRARLNTTRNARKDRIIQS